MIPTDKTCLHLHKGEKYIHLFEDLELLSTPEQLQQIRDEWESGRDIGYIAKKERRKPLEIFFCLLHLADKNVLKRPFAYRVH